MRAFISSAESGFERRATQADRVTGAEAAGAKAVAASVTGARCAPHGEQMRGTAMEVGCVRWVGRTVMRDGKNESRERQATPRRGRRLAEESRCKRCFGGGLAVLMRRT